MATLSDISHLLIARHPWGVWAPTPEHNLIGAVIACTVNDCTLAELPENPQTYAVFTRHQINMKSARNFIKSDDFTDLCELIRWDEKTTNRVREYALSRYASSTRELLERRAEWRRRYSMSRRPSKPRIKKMLCQ